MATNFQKTTCVQCSATPQAWQPLAWQASRASLILVPATDFQCLEQGKRLLCNAWPSSVSTCSTATLQPSTGFQQNNACPKQPRLHLGKLRGFWLLKRISNVWNKARELKPHDLGPCNAMHGRPPRAPAQQQPCNQVPDFNKTTRVRSSHAFILASFAGFADFGS